MNSTPLFAGYMYERRGENNIKLLYRFDSGKHNRASFSHGDILRQGQDGLHHPIFAYDQFIWKSLDSSLPRRRGSTTSRIEVIPVLETLLQCHCEGVVKLKLAEKWQRRDYRASSGRSQWQKGTGETIFSGNGEKSVWEIFA